MSDVTDFVETAVFNSRYETTELIFHEATSAHFTCKYAYRDDATVYHVYPGLIERADDIVSNVLTILDDSVPADVRARSRAEVMRDDDIGGVSVCVIVPDFTAETRTASEMLAKRVITRLHDALSH